MGLVRLKGLLEQKRAVHRSWGMLLWEAEVRWPGSKRIVLATAQHTAQYQTDHLRAYILWLIASHREPQF